MNYLSCLFEEDIELQDSLDDLQTNDNSEDIIIGATEDRYGEKENNEIHLFTDNPISQINDDGLTPEEENELNVALLNGDITNFDDEPDDDNLI